MKFLKRELNLTDNLNKTKPSIAKLPEVTSYSTQSSNHVVLHSFFFIRIYFKRISRLKFAKFWEYLKNKPEAEIVKRK